MAIHWSFSFKAIRSEKVYTVDIYDANYIGTPVQLIGADSPFVIQEDDDEDIFLPVRTQSGYLRFVDDGSIGMDWRDIIPKSVFDRPVVLRYGRTIEWCGFIQMVQPDYEMYDYPSVREYAIYDVLEALKEVKFKINNVPPADVFVNFAYCLKIIFDQLPTEVRPQQFYFGQMTTSRLMCKVSPQVFTDIDDSGTVWAYNCQQILEYIAVFWNFTIRSKGASIYCIEPLYGINTLLSVTYSQLNLLSNGTSAGTNEPLTQNIYIQGSWLVSTDNILQSVKNNDIKIPDVDVKENKTLIDIPEARWSIDYTRLIISTHFESQKDKYDNISTVWGDVNAEDYWNILQYPSDSTLEMRWPYSFANTYLSIKGELKDKDWNTIKVEGRKNPAGDTVVYMVIELYTTSGVSYYFTPQQGWTTTYRECTCYAGGVNDFFYPFDNSRTIKYVTFNTMPIPPVGRLKIRMLGAKTGWLSMTKFLIEVNNMAESPFYKSKGSETIFSGIDMYYGSCISLVLNANNTPYNRRDVPMGKGIYGYWENAKIVANLELNNANRNITNITPSNRLIYSNIIMYPFSISKDYRNETAKIRAISISSNDQLFILLTLVAGRGISSVTGGGTILYGDPRDISCNVVSGYIFDHWEDEQHNVLSTSRNYTIPSVTNDMTLTAVAILDTTMFTVTILQVPGVTYTTGSGTYRVGSSVNINCTIEEGYIFAAWMEDNIEGTILSEEQSFNLTVTGNITILPYIVVDGEDISRLYFRTEQPGWGIITDENGDVYTDGNIGEFAYDEEKHFTAVPATGYEFIAWYLDNAPFSIAPTIDITINDGYNDSILKAVFSQLPIVTEWDLTLRTSVKDAVIRVNGATYDFPTADTVYEINISADVTVELYGYYNGFNPVSFMGWRDTDQPNTLLQANPIDFVMNKNKDITIVFE